MAINFPDSPATNDSFTSGGKKWIFDGTTWGLITANSYTIPTGEVTAAKIASNAVTEAKINAGAVTQAKLASGLSGITVTTTENRSAVIPSPFTGQFIFLTDTSALQRWDGSAWVAAITTVPTGAPASVAVSGSPTKSTVTLTFSAGADGGSAITNYQYALSTNGGTTYGEYTALSPADASSPITITGLALGTTYYVKLKAVNALGTGSSESSAVSFTTESLATEYLVIGGGGSGGIQVGGGGGAGGYRTNMVGATSGRGSAAGGYNLASAGSSPTGNNRGAKGTDSVFSTITSLGGGGGSGYSNLTATNGGSGGGADGGGQTNFGAGTANQGYAGGQGVYGSWSGGGGGGAGAVGGNGGANVGGVGGAGLSSSITGTAVTRGGGGAGCQTSGAGSAGGAGGGGAGGSDSVNAGNGSVNTGGGGGGTRDAGTNGSGGSGIVIVRYLTADAATATITGGTATTSGLYTVRTFTASGSLVIA
jgi:hypothetical protein